MSETQNKQMLNSQVILVDENDIVLGQMDKYNAHRTLPAPCLHRAFSLFLFDSKNRLLIQQRSHEKLTFPLIWANTCCSHPEPGEDIIPASKRRVKFELNIDLNDEAKLQELGVFRYKAEFGEWTEYEVDHVVFGYYDTEVILFNKEEVEAVKWVSKEEFGDMIECQPETLSPWIRMIWTRFLSSNWDLWNQNHHIELNNDGKFVVQE